MCYTIVFMDGVATGIRHFNSKNDYLKRDVLKNTKPNAVKNSIKQVLKKSDKVEISKEAKDVAKQGAVNRGIDSAASVIGKVLKTSPSGISTPKIAAPSTSAAKRVKKVSVKVEPRVIRRPGVMFINGFSFFGNSDDSGLNQMARFVPGAETYSHSQGDQILNSILKRPASQPILLIGHGLGGDTAVEVAKELNSMKNGFREVKLLVTLDSVGFNNDIIPQNVRNNLNYIGDQGGLFNDGPNIARSPDYTNVINELRPEGHSEMVDSRDVQYKVFEGINKVLQDCVIQNNLASSSIYNINSLRGAIFRN